jgi:TonB-dependent starch-binding outer membrane protein SusC
MCLMFFCTMATFAQNKLTGKIADSGGNGIPGVSILVKGTKTGATTDVNGGFSVNAGPNSTLVISSIGFKTQEVAVGNQSSLNVTMADDASTFDEIVVTGYSVDKRRDATGAVSIVKAKDLSVRPSGNIENQLQGRVAGLTVITNGQAGANSQVRVRGFGAFGGNEPLYVVDGVPVGSTNFLNPDDVESVTVLKDAATASIYGARAANGVIVYTTKKGKKGAKKLEVSYDGLFGMTNPGPGQAMMNPTDFATWTWNAKRNGGAIANDPVLGFNHPQFGNGASPIMPEYLTTIELDNLGKPTLISGGSTQDPTLAKKYYNIDPKAGPLFQVTKANKAGTDWYGAITRNAPVQRHSLGFSGGGDNSRFYVGLGIQDQKGILITNQLKRYGVRINTEFNILKNLRLGENLQVTYLQNLGQSGAAGGQGIAADENDILQAFRMPSIIPVYDEFGGYAGTASKGFNNPRNPVANQNGLKNNRNYNALGSGNIYVELDPIAGLTLRSSLGANYNNNYFWNYGRLQYENSENNSAFSYGEGGGFSLAWTLTNTANYKKAFGKHGVELLVGQEALNTGAGRNMNGNGLDPFSTDLDYVTITNVGSRQVGSNLFRGVNFYSLFGRAIYNFNDKYMLTGVIRRDGSSRFGVNNRYGIFPAVSGAWRISSEQFMKGLSWVQDLKIRGGYGTMGNSNNVDPNNQYSLYTAGVGSTGYDINGSNSSIVEGYARNRIGNPNAKWETSITKNIGFDGTFFNGKLDVIVDLWQKDTKDLLYQLPITATAGAFAAAPSVNVGQMVNKGLDIQLTTRGKFTTDLTYELDVTGGFLNNKITKIADGQTYLTNVNPGFRGLNPIRNQLGYSISSFYGLKVAGLFQSKEEVAAAPAQDGKGVGRFRYVDVNGDGKVDASDRTYLGSPVPKFTGGLNFTVHYKNFDVSSYMNVFMGNKIFNASKWFTDFYPSFSGAAISERVKNSWSPTNTGATIPIFETASNFSTNAQANSFYIEDGSYFRMQNINVGYNIPTSVLKQLKLNRVRVFGSLNNLFTITKYQGLDPSVGGNADTNFGIDVGNYPNTKSWNVGLNIGF